jgi:hypothetical protein
MGVTVEIGAGWEETMAAIRLVLELPWNARFPVAISYRSAPSAKMSVRASASAPSSCSGAIYWKVPRIVPCAVKGPACWGMAVGMSEAGSERAADRRRVSRRGAGQPEVEQLGA